MFSSAIMLSSAVENSLGLYINFNQGLKNQKQIKNICNVGNKFFNLSNKSKKKLSPKKWNSFNNNIYRGYFPNDVNGKEGLALGDLKITKKYSNKVKNPYIEQVN